MPLFLKKRDLISKERMDRPDCSKQELFNTYKQFSVINSLISRWRYIYKSRIRPECSDKSKTYSLLDIGFGGGDLVIKISKWARQDGISLDIIAVETDERAIEFIQSLETPSNITFRHISSSELLTEGRPFDFIISNHLLHHLNKNGLLQLLEEAKQLSRKQVLFNDIERSDLGYLSFNIFSRPLFRSSFITQDGLTSIKRSYTSEELEHAVPDDWNVHRIIPYRLLLHYTHA